MNKKGFTLLELLAGIAIVGIFVLSATNFNFRSTTDRQRLEIFGNKIISEIETIRNNDLMGRKMGTGSIQIPEKWEIEFGLNGSGSVISKYYLNSSDTEINNLYIENLYSINSLTCKNPNGNNHNITGNETGTIIFEKGNYSIGGDCDLLPGTNELIINIGYKSIESNITFNAINGLIKRD